MPKKIVSFLFFLLIGTISNAQSEKYIFKNYDSQDGLSDNTINSIICDDRGFVWVGTRDGICRFDGAEFKTFNFSNASNTLGNYYTSFVKIDSDKILLLNNQKLAVLNTSNYTLKLVDSFSKIVVTDITPIGDNLLALHIKNRLVFLNRKLEIISTYQISDNQNAIATVRKLSENKVLICDYYQFHVFDLKQKTTTALKFDFKDYYRVNYSNYDIEFIDNQQKLIYVSDYFTGLYIFDYSGKLLSQYSPELPKNQIASTNVLKMLKTKTNEIWVATDRGISIIKNNKSISIAHSNENNLSLKSDVVTTFYEDKNSNIWIGTNQGMSVYKNTLNLKVEKFFYTNDEAQTISNIAVYNNDLYIGSYLEKTYKYDRSNSKITLLNGLPGAWNVKSIDNEIYVYGSGTEKEIGIINPKTNQNKKISFLKNYYTTTDIVTLVYKHSNGDMWYSGNSGGGFVRVDSKTNRIEHYLKNKNGKLMFPSSYYHEVAEDANKNLWFGVNKSNLLLKWEYKTNTFKEYDFNNRKDIHKKVLGGITSIKSDAKKNIWIAYEGGGIIKFTPQSDKIKQYSTENGLNTNFINNIEFDSKNRLWILTNKGVSCIRTDSDDIDHMNVWDGFVANPLTYSVLKMDVAKNQMLIGSTNCFYSFNPDEIIKNKLNTTKVYIDEVKVNNKKNVDLSSTAFHFKPNENNLEFEIVAIDIENGKNLEYGYKLEGFNNQWVNLKSNKSVIFPKLNAGNYIFNARVRAKGNSNWIYLSKPFSFTIANYWYQTWWFFGLLTLAVLSILFALISFYFKRKLEKQQNELDKQKAIEDERKRIAKDMHDDLGSGLTKITYLSQMALLDKTNQEHVVNINKTSTELVESMSEIIWFMKDENNSWEELLLFIKKYAVEYCTNNSLSISFNYPDTLLQSELNGEKRRNIFLSIKEILHNIVKHAQATEVSIQVHQNSKVHIVIHDNGIGILSENSSKKIGGNGLKNIRERMKFVNASFNIENNGGTRISFVIPI